MLVDLLIGIRYGYMLVLFKLFILLINKYIPISQKETTIIIFIISFFRSLYYKPVIVYDIIGMWIGIYGCGLPMISTFFNQDLQLSYFLNL